MMRISDGSGLMKTICLSLIALCLSCSTNGKDDAQDKPDSWTVTITGKVGHPQSGNISISEVGEDGEGWTDTITLQPDQTFTKEIRLTEPGYFRLNFYNKQVLMLILDRSDIEVNVDGNSQQGFAEVKGSPDLDLIQRVQQIQQSINADPAMTDLNSDFTRAAQQKDEATMDKLRADYQAIAKKYNDRIAALMVEHSPSLAVINLLQNNAIDRDAYFETYLQVAGKLQAEWAGYDVAQEFIDYVERMKLIAIGQKAPEIALPNPEGEIVKLSSLRGQYVLVDFWAKWCGPCRQENPNVVRAYQKYKDEGFTVYGVSLDRNRQDWLQAIEQDNLTWTHVSDLKYWQSEAAKTYNITGIPFSLLLDPEGKIVAKNLRGPALHQKLAEIFGR